MAMNQFKPGSGVEGRAAISVWLPDRYEEAEAAYRQAIELNPDDATAYYNLACLYALQKKVAQTIDSLQQAIQLDAKCRNIARTDTDFDGIREDPSFQGLLDHDDFT